jgi:hypothetical protein
MGKETKPMFNLTNKQAKVLDELIMMEKTTETKNAWISFRLLANVSAKEYDNIKQEGGDDNGIQT